MKTFIDANGKEWKLSLNVGVLKHIRDDLGLDFLASNEAPLKSIQWLSDNVELLVNTLFLLVEKQASEAGISDIAFGESLDGDSVERANTAFLEELVLFFPSQKRRALNLALERTTAIMDKAIAKLEAKLNSPEMEAEIDAALEKAATLPAAEPQA